MNWNDISPDVQGFIREPFEDEPQSDVVPEPEDMRRRRELWAALPTMQLPARMQAHRPGSTVLDGDHHPYRTRPAKSWKVKIAIGLAASVMVALTACIGSLMQTQRGLKRQLAEQLRQQQATVGELGEVRRSDRELKTTVNDLTEQLAAANSLLSTRQFDHEDTQAAKGVGTPKQSWPPDRIVLTDVPLPTGLSESPSYTHIVWLYRKSGNNYVGLALPARPNVNAIWKLEGALSSSKYVLSLTWLSDNSVQDTSNEPPPAVSNLPKYDLFLDVQRKSFYAKAGRTYFQGKMLY